METPEQTTNRHTCLPVLAKHQVRSLQGSGTPHMCPLLAIVGHVEGDPALSLGLIENAVHGVEQRHAPVQLQDLLLGQLQVEADRWGKLGLEESGKGPRHGGPGRGAASRGDLHWG